MSVAMKDAEFQWQALGDPRLAAYAASRLPAWLWTADGTRILWANPAGARRVRCGQRRGAAEQSFGPADRHRRQIARLVRPAARERRHPAGAPAGIWRRARHARDLRLLAVRLCRRQPRRSDRRRQHPADRAAPGADAARQRDAAGRRIAEPVLQSRSCRSHVPERPVIASERSTGAAGCPTARRPRKSGEAPAEVCAVRCVGRARRRRRAARRRNHAPAAATVARAPIARHRSIGRARRRRAACRCASPGRWIAKAASRSAPTNSRADRPAHHGRVRPAVARDRRDLRASIPPAG